MIAKTVTGFSKKTKEEKIDWLIMEFLDQDLESKKLLNQYWNNDSQLQKLHDDFVENTVSNFYLPFAVAPNFLINGMVYAIPMVIEESSVVAAASNAAKFWLSRGGFRARVISSDKNGQIHLDYHGSKEELYHFFGVIKDKLIESISALQKNMQARGGGLSTLTLEDRTQQLAGYYYIHAQFETKDAMGANFINSCLEQMATTWKTEANSYDYFLQSGKFPKVIMSILSNYVPECVVSAEVSCSVDELSNNGMDGRTFAENFVKAVEIAQIEPRRAVTHNKGIMNGIDAVVIATGNDFRAIEAGIHAYAAKDGCYKSLTTAKLEGDQFTFSIEVPLALGTIGGLTNLHPLVKVALSILQKPSAKELMQIVAVAGLAQNFAALRSLITTGIQKGHMKMHLMNILNQLEASDLEKELSVQHFRNHTINHREVVEFLEKIRN